MTSIRRFGTTLLLFCGVITATATAQVTPGKDDGARSRGAGDAQRGQGDPRGGGDPRLQGTQRGDDPRGGGDNRPHGGMGGQERLRPPGGRDEWQLGAVVDVTDTGVRIRSVERGSAAERAGLESGDTIVNVAGYQVGRVGGRHYSLEDELQRQADNAGRVSLLVQNRRNSRLTNIDVRLDRGGRPGDRDSVSGRALFASNDRLPRGAQMRVKLVRKAFFGERTVAENTTAVGGQPPIEFDLRFDPRQVERDKEHELVIEIIDRGRVVFENASTLRIRLDRPGERYDVRMRPR